MTFSQKGGELEAKLLQLSPARTQFPDLDNMHDDAGAKKLNMAPAESSGKRPG